MREHNTFDNFEEKAKSMVSSNELSVSGVTDSEEYDTNLQAYSQEKSRVRKRKSFHDERQLGTASTEQDQQTVRTAREQFRIETYLTIIDKLRMEIDKRKNAYSKVDGRFGLLTKFKNFSDADIAIKAKPKNLYVAFYPNAIEDDFASDFFLQNILYQYRIQL